MGSDTLPRREHWASKLGFVLASAGSAIGLGNIWRFPYKAGQYGGGAFVLTYIAAVIIIGIPVMIAEFIIGRSTQKNPVGSFRAMRESKFWPIVGWLGIAAGFLILSYYSVVGGWILRYIWYSAVYFFQADTAKSTLDSFLSNPVAQVFWHGVFMVLTVLIVRGGVSSGIERWNKILMPSLFAIMVLLTLNSLRSPGAWEGINFMFKPDFSKLSAAGILEALGHAFFSLSLGMGAMITYGSYLDKETNISASSLEVVGLNTVYALLAGLMIFPIVFTYQVDPKVGPGLFFITLPEVFARMPSGYIVSILFFVLVTFAALTSSISLLEVVISYFIDEHGWQRQKAAYVIGFIIFLAGIPSALSFNIFHDLTIIPDKNIFDSCDIIATNFMLPIGGLFIAIFAGWVLTHSEKENEIRRVENTFHFYDIWHFLIKYITPLALIILLLYTSGILSIGK